MEEMVPMADVACDEVEATEEDNDRTVAKKEGGGTDEENDTMKDPASSPVSSPTSPRRLVPHVVRRDTEDDEVAVDFGSTPSATLWQMGEERLEAIEVVSKALRSVTEGNRDMAIDILRELTSSIQDETQFGEFYCSSPDDTSLKSPGLDL